MSWIKIAGKVFRAKGDYRKALENGEVEVVDELDVGEGNEGVYILEYSRGEDASGTSGSSQKEVLIKKNSASKLEYLFCSWLCETSDPVADKIFPKIYDCLEHDGHKVILLEYLPKAGEITSYEPKVAEALADWVLMFNGLGARKTAPRFISRRCKVVNRRLSRERSAWLISNSREKLSEDYFSDDVLMRDYLKNSVDCVLSHGDLGFPNIYIDDRASELQIKVFDFAHVKFMTPGAEFHHFARHSLASSEDKDFFDHLTDYYGKKSGTCIDKVRMGAYLYAMDRQLGRTSRRLKGMSSRKLKNDVSTVVSLYNESQRCFRRLMKKEQ